MPRPKKPTCQFCNRKFDRDQGRAAHERMCEQNPEREKNMAQARRARRAHATVSNGNGRNGHSRGNGRMVELPSTLELLGALFPTGIPVEEEVLGQVGDWIARTDTLRDVAAECGAKVAKPTVIKAR
jgi:hypothetical protein